MTFSPTIAVVGAGYWGVNHVRNFHQLGALRAVCDTSEPSVERIRERFPDARIDCDLRSVLEDPQVRGIVIATPAETHYRVARAALEAGKDALVEKPLTLDADEARLLIDLAQERRRILMVGHLLEFHPAILRLRELVSSGALGELRYIYSTRLNLGKVRREENILWSFAPHDIAVILRLTGCLPLKVTATGGAYLQPRTADVTITHLKFPGGVRAHIFVSWLHPYKEQRMSVIGSSQMAVFDDVVKQDKLMLYDQGVEIVAGEPVTRKREAAPEQISADEPLRNQCLHFLHCIETRATPLTDGQSGLRVLRVLEAAEKSLASGGEPVSVSEK
jgi:predicted dehydrogenase